jgi:light-regulated signal transduction histidine kinase (bacteriophytochrome)
MIKHIEIEAPEMHPFYEDEPTAAELRRKNAVLTHRIERGAAQLRAAEAELDLLAHWIAHDLRSPLTVMGGFAELLRKHSGHALDEKGSHYLQTIENSTVQIGQMLDDILALSRMSRSEMHLVHIDVEALARRIVGELDAAKGDRRVIWTIEKLPTVQADPTLLRHALGSLASNALRFTRSCEVARIHIGSRPGEGELIFFVRDNAAGIDLNHRERMFGSFQRPDSPEGRRGSALGLTYVQRIIQRHGGRTWVEAAPEGGSAFFFSLPSEPA